MADETSPASQEESNEETNGPTPYLKTTESKRDMANALTSLISTFRDETEQQDQLLSVLQNDAANPDFAKKSRAAQWTVNEVCYWLTTLGLQDYVNIFYASTIDGTMLLNDIDSNILTNDLNVKPLHCSKILREINNLKNTSASPTPHNEVQPDANLNDIIASIKKENEVLLTELQQQKQINTQLSSSIPHHKPSDSDFHCIPNGAVDTNTNTQSHKSLQLSDITQKKTIQDLTDKLRKLQQSSDRKIRELLEKNKKLQDGYICIETHYQKQLDDARRKSKTLEAQLSSSKSINYADNNNNIELLWSENENTAKDLENEKEKRVMLEASLRAVQLSLNGERQKRKLLESQTSRLTSELTKYLTKVELKNDKSKKERFKFKLNKNKSGNSEHETGWVRFLNAAGSVRHKSLTNLQQKLNKNESKESVNEVDNKSKHKNRSRHGRKVSFGESVIKTFKKIQSATKAKMEERNKRKTSIDEIKEEDRYYIDDEQKVNKVNINIDNDDEYDEDSSAEKAELQIKRNRILITAPNGGFGGHGMAEEDEEDSDGSDGVIIKRGDGSPTNMGIEFLPALEALRQTPELDTDASF